MKKPTAQIYYSNIKSALFDYCVKNTDFEPEINEDSYPYGVRYHSTEQLTISEDGETRTEQGGDLTVIVGMITKVKSTLKSRIDAKLLKKLIKLAENAADAYYHAFREAADSSYGDADQEAEDDNA